MTNPINIIRSLDMVSTGYTVFEKDQVLTEKQLNGITNYLDDQDRLTRIELLGVGIVGGLRVKLAGNKVIAGKGVGVTTDGDLPVLLADATFDRYKNYDEKAPIYLPFYPQAKGTNLGPMMQLFELVREGEKDALAKDMSSLPVKLGNMVVIIYMESYQQDHNLCSGTDCDNLGQEVTNTVRFLLVGYKDAASLLNTLATGSALSLLLPEISADRPLLGKNITTVLALASAYYSACNSIVASLKATLPSLYKTLPGFIGDLFEGDPSQTWLATIGSQFKKTFKTDSNMIVLVSAATHYTCFYDYLKDLAETWNALRDVLFDDDSVLCPDINAFPKHLLLGRLSNPVEMRTGLFPSPLIDNGNSVREHARFLAWKLHTLINNFELPKDNVIVVTPSSDESVPLEERAIPYYYMFKSDLPIHLGWNYRLDMRGAATRNLGYRAPAYGGSTAALKPLNYQLGRYNFFRIEGHLGQNAEKVKKDIEDAIARYNLPFTLRAVLLHNDRKKIIIRPPFRHTPLHGLHYLIRKDVATQLDDSRSFNQSLKEGISGAASRQEIPATLNGKATTVASQENFALVDAAITKASAPLGNTRYSEYRKSLTSPAGNWKSAYKDTVAAASTYKLNFGAMVRTEFSTPFDSLMTSNHSLWLDWLDNLIDHHDASEDDKLLFSNFITIHPGLEHSGGVTRGGTFVLVYDDKATVVADLMLPYYAAETAENEPDEPELPLTPYKPDVAIKSGFTLQQPIDAMFTKQLDDFKAKIQPEWTKEIDMQKNYQDFFTKSLQAFDSVFTAKNISAGGTGNAGGRVGNYSDPMIDVMMNAIVSKQQQVEQLRQIVLQPDTPSDILKTAQTQLKEAEAGLVKTISNSTQYIAQNKVDVSTGSDGSKALNLIATSMDKVSDSVAVASLKTGLQGAADKASGAQLAALNNLSRLKGF